MKPFWLRVAFWSPGAHGLGHAFVITRTNLRPGELERRRRAMLNTYGKMGDASVVEIQGTVAIYSYDVRGVEYTAAQDFSRVSL